jgi:hypothetical protein
MTRYFDSRPSTLHSTITVAVSSSLAAFLTAFIGKDVTEAGEGIGTQSSQRSSMSGGADRGTELLNYTRGEERKGYGCCESQLKCCSAGREKKIERYLGVCSTDTAERALATLSVSRFADRGSELHQALVPVSGTI